MTQIIQSITDPKLSVNVLNEAEILKMHTATLDAIESVGVKFPYMRERWMPDLMDRRSYGVWEKEKGGARHWAREKAQEILTNHRPDPLPPELKKELLDIISRIEDRAQSLGLV